MSIMNNSKRIQQVEFINLYLNIYVAIIKDKKPWIWEGTGERRQRKEERDGEDVNVLLIQEILSFLKIYYSSLLNCNKLKAPLMSFVGSLGKLLPSFKLRTVEPQTRMSTGLIAFWIDLESLMERKSVKYLYDNLSKTKPCQQSREVLSGSCGWKYLREGQHL